MFCHRLVQSAGFITETPGQWVCRHQALPDFIADKNNFPRQRREGVEQRSTLVLKCLFGIV